MSAPIQQLVIDAAASRLSAITIANGRSRDIPATLIFKTRVTDTQVQTPAIQIVQQDENVLEDSSDRYNCELPLLIIGVDDLQRAPDPRDMDGWARLLLADIEWAMGRQLAVGQPFSQINVTNESTSLVESVTVQFFQKAGQGQSGINAGPVQPGRTFCHLFVYPIYVRSIFDPSKQ